MSDKQQLAWANLVYEAKNLQSLDTASGLLKQIHRLRETLPHLPPSRIKDIEMIILETFKLGLHSDGKDNHHDNLHS